MSGYTLNSILKQHDGMSISWFFFFLIALLGGLYFYDFGYCDFIDEALTISLFGIICIRILLGRCQNFSFFYKYMAIVIFYILYSIIINSNCLYAIVIDALSFSKGIIAFSAACLFRLRFSSKQKKILRIIVYVLAIIMIFYWVLMPKTSTTQQGSLFAGSRFGNIAFLLALLYYFSSAENKKNFWVFIGIFSIGLLRPTSKFIVLFYMSFFVRFYIDIIRRHLYISSLVIIVLLLGCSFFVWEDIDFYMIRGFDREFARPILYSTMWNILWDYFPFGSGFASFATSSSVNYYSTIYGAYQIDQVFGISKEYSGFASDTFYPALGGQLGIVGIIIFIAFFYWLLKHTLFLPLCTRSAKIDKFCILMLSLFWWIESVADSTFISNRGFFGMFLTGIIFSELRYMSKEQNRKLNESVS